MKKKKFTKEYKNYKFAKFGVKDWLQNEERRICIFILYFLDICPVFEDFYWHLQIFLNNLYVVFVCPRKSVCSVRTSKFGHATKLRPVRVVFD